MGAGGNYSLFIMQYGICTIISADASPLIDDNFEMQSLEANLHSESQS